MIFMLIVLSMQIAFGYEWVLPRGTQTPTVYFQGVFESQRQCSRYCGVSGLQATTGEQVICKDAQELILNPFVGKELDEVMLKNSPASSWLNIWPHHAIYGWKGRRSGFGYQNTQNNDLSVSSHAIDYFKMNFAQQRDIAEHAKKMQLCAKQYPKEPVILWGVSRGAAATLNACASNTYENVALVVLEGCFDTIDHTIQERGSSSFAKRALWSSLYWLIQLATQYDAKGPSPLRLVESFPPHVPVVFITSAKDTSVSKLCTQKVVDALQKRGKNPVHYLCLEHSGHNRYAIGSGPDQQRYMRFMHTIYKQYDLPYIPAFAA